MRMILIDEEIRQAYGCDAIILIDAEGLFSSEKMNDPEASRKQLLMTTFAMGVSNLTMVNVPVEGMTEMSEVLQIAIVAMVHLKRGGIKPDIILVQHLQEQNQSKIDNAKGQLCETINKAFKLIENDVEICSASEECLDELSTGIQSGGIFVHVGNYRDLNSRQSELYHEDVVRMQGLLLNRTQALENKSTFERWSSNFERYWGSAEKGEFDLYFQFGRHEIEIEYIERKIDKVSKLYASSMWHHLIFFTNKIREQISLLIENKNKIQTDAMPIDILSEMEHMLQTIPHDCSDTCGMCREFNSYYIFLLQAGS